MKLTLLLLLFALVSVSASTYSQNTRLDVDIKGKSIIELFREIEEESEFYFLYQEKDLEQLNNLSVELKGATVMEILDEVLKGTSLEYKVVDRYVIIRQSGSESEFSRIMADQQRTVSGTVTDDSGEPLPGVSIIIKGTTTGTVTGSDGNYSLSNVSEDATLVFSFVGMKTQEVEVGNQTEINVTLETDAIGIEEVVAIGYGTMRKSDLTGSVSQADIEMFEEQPNISIAQSLQGAVAGLNVGQINEAGEEPRISIRGQTSLAGEQNPLIILDGVMYRGNLIDINPADIESIDVLKDNSAAAVYGSQAANGVILITSKSGADGTAMPKLRYSSSYAIQRPTKYFRPGDAADFVAKNTAIDWKQSRTPESGYLDSRPDYPVESTFKTSEQVENYFAGVDVDWYDLMTNDNMHIQKHNLSLSHKNQYLNYYISMGYDEQTGYMLNEDYNRYTARVNLDNHVTDWLLVGIQTFASFSDYSGEDMSTDRRYAMIPFDKAYLENGEVNQQINGSSSPLAIAQSDNLDQRNNLFGNIYAEIDFPFIKGLTYKINFYNNYRTTRFYYFYPFSQNFQGEGGKNYAQWYDLSSDNILSYKKRFNEHQVDATAVYGFEKRKNDFTNNQSSVFVNPVLGYNRLQAGTSELQQVSSGAWEETSIYTMARLFYSFKDKYMFTGTVRRDGFSGFSEEYKFGIFPSLALGWVASEEPFFTDISSFLNYLKLRVSYGSIGNRTIGRYQTLAKVSGEFGYVDEYGESIYTQYISSLASSELRWETTTGINLGIDFGLFDSRILGSMEYYNNNTHDLLYEVDLPAIARFQKFPDNLGRIHNTGIEISLSSVNINQGDFRWNSDFTFSRNRDELKELLGFDNDGDGVEDDLISERLFINEPLHVVYHYEVDGIYQLNDEIPAGAMVGSYKIVDQNDDDEIDPENDYRILGYRNPSYRFSINNQFSYRNWSLKVFVNAIQGGKDFYYAADNIHFYIENSGFANTGGGLQHFWLSYPENLDYWLPENPDAKYQTPDIAIPENLMASRWAQRSFVRLQDVSLSYTLRNNFLQKISVNNLKLFVSGKNLITWTNWPGWDPETGEGISRTGRPVMRSYTLGLNVEF